MTRDFINRTISPAGTEAGRREGAHLTQKSKNGEEKIFLLSSDVYRHEKTGDVSMLMFQEAFNGRTCLGSWEPRKCTARTCRNERMSFTRHETVTRDIACYLYRSNFSRRCRHTARHREVRLTVKIIFVGRQRSAISPSLRGSFVTNI